MKVALRAAVTVAVLVLLALVLPWHDVIATVRRLSPLVWIGSLGLFLLGHQLGAVKWRLLINAGHGRLGLLDATRCYAAGLFANICLPSIVGGDVLRAVLAGRSTGGMEAAVLGGGVGIADGDTTPDSTDGTDFGSVSVGGVAVQRTFTVRNDGTAALTTSGLAVPAGFTIVEPLSASIAAGDFDTFTVRLDTAIDNAMAERVADLWERQGMPVARFEFARSHRLGHELIDPLEPGADPALTYPVLLDMIEGVDAGKTAAE